MHLAFAAGSGGAVSRDQVRNYRAATLLGENTMVPQCRTFMRQQIRNKRMEVRNKNYYCSTYYVAQQLYVHDWESKMINNWDGSHILELAIKDTKILYNGLLYKYNI